MRRTTVSVGQYDRTILFFLILSLVTDISYAAPIIYRQQRVKAMRQQQEQEEYEQYYQQQQQGQQQGAQTQNQQAAVEQTYQQKVDQRNQAIAQAILSANNQAELNQIAHGEKTGQVAGQTGPSDVRDVVDLSDVWKKLDTKSTVWTALIDDQAKLLTVSEYIDRFQKEGVKIQAPPLHYVQEIDQLVGQNPQMLQRPFGELLQIMAIVDYDFDNGMDKDILAKKVLGEAGFEANKKRFTQQSQQQQPPGGSAGP